jgi:hypothetical protein
MMKHVIKGFSDIIDPKKLPYSEHPPTLHKQHLVPGKWKQGY